MGYQLIAYFPPAVHGRTHTAVSFFLTLTRTGSTGAPEPRQWRGWTELRGRICVGPVGARRRAAPLKGVLSATTNFLFCFFNEHPVLSSYRWPD